MGIIISLWMTQHCHNIRRGMNCHFAKQEMNSVVCWLFDTKGTIYFPKEVVLHLHCVANSHLLSVVP